jgi:Zn-dependent M16 (insulinase) family peptidase
MSKAMGHNSGNLFELHFKHRDCNPNCCLLYALLSQVRGKAMGHNSGDLFELMGDILATARLDDRARFTQMVAETKANMEAGIIGSGHRCVT